MKILLTNDDGVDSPGILLLAAVLRKAGHRVFMVAPASNQSGVSNAISFFSGPCKLTEIEKDTWSCAGTPADCVIIALMGGIPELSIIENSEMGTKNPPPDLILSGINKGANLGTDIVYSGTAAAARQGSLIGIPSAALSLVEGETWYWDTAAAFVAGRLDEIRSAWKPGAFININMPNRQETPAAMIHSFPSRRYYTDHITVYTAPDGSRYCFAQTGKISVKPEKGSDWETTTEGKASISDVYIHPILLESVKERGEA